MTSPTSSKELREAQKKQLTAQMWEYLDWYSGAPREEKKALVHRMLDIWDSNIEALITKATKALLEGLPEDVMYKCHCGVMYSKATGYCSCGAFIAYQEKDTDEIKGYNKALSDVHAILTTLRKEG